MFFRMLFGLVLGLVVARPRTYPTMPPYSRDARPAELPPTPPPGHEGTWPPESETISGEDAGIYEAPTETSPIPGGLSRLEKIQLLRDLLSDGVSPMKAVQIVRSVDQVLRSDTYSTRLSQLATTAPVGAVIELRDGAMRKAEDGSLQALGGGSSGAESPADL